MTHGSQVELLYIVEELIDVTLKMAQAEHTRDDLYYLSNKIEKLKKGVEHEVSSINRTCSRN